MMVVMVVVMVMVMVVVMVVVVVMLPLWSWPVWRPESELAGHAAGLEVAGWRPELALRGIGLELLVWSWPVWSCHRRQRVNNG